MIESPAWLWSVVPRMQTSGPLAFSVDPDSPFVRDAANKLVRRGYWMDMDDRTLVMVMVNGIGAHLTNDEKRAHLVDLRRGHLIEQVCVQEDPTARKRVNIIVAIVTFMQQDAISTRVKPNKNEFGTRIDLRLCRVGSIFRADLLGGFDKSLRLLRIVGLWCWFPRHDKILAWSYLFLQPLAHPIQKMLHLR